MTFTEALLQIAGVIYEAENGYPGTASDHIDSIEYILEQLRKG